MNNRQSGSYPKEPDWSPRLGQSLKKRAGKYGYRLLLKWLSFDLLSY